MFIQLNRYRKRQPTLKKNSWDLDRLKDKIPQMFYRGTVTLTLEEQGVKDIQNKDQLSIKTGGPALITEIHRLCNMIWQEDEWSEQWTKSILVTIPKKGDLTDCANYRTIALITHLSKILLLVILKRLTASDIRRMSQRRTSRVQERQEYYTTDSYTSIDC